MSRPSSAWLVASAVSCHRPDGTALLADIHFALDTERVGLVGPNGSGKSTLLAVLSGARVPDSGHVTRRGRVAVLSQLAAPPSAVDGRTSPVDTVAQRLGKADVLAALARCSAGEGTAEDVLCIGTQWDLAERLEALLQTFDLGHIGLHRRWSSLSGGEATRVRLAALLHDAPEVLLLDEPTNDLDAAHREAVYTLVRHWPGALLVVTHDRQLLEHVDRIEAVEQGTLRRYGGNYAHYRAERALQRDAAERELSSALAARERVQRAQHAAKERQDRRDAAGRRARARGGQAKILLGMQAERSEGTGARLQGIRQRENDEAAARVRDAQARLDEVLELKFPVSSSGLASGTLVFAMHDATLGVGEPAEALLWGLTFELRGPERVAVVGPNGSGKSTLLRVLAGERAPLDATRVHRGVPMEEVVYLDQQVTVLSRHGSLLAAMQHVTQRMVVQRGGVAPDEAALRGALARFGFRRDLAYRSADALSGGERMRAALACVLGVPGLPAPRLLLLDEPTNHLDLGSLEALETVLQQFDGALVVASHDEAFLHNIGVSRRVLLPDRNTLTEPEEIPKFDLPDFTPHYRGPAMSSTASALSTADLLAQWQGHRRLTRRVIEAFPEESLHSFSVGGMRPFAALAGEMLAIAVPMLREIVSGEAATYTEAVPASKAELLAAWDAATPELDAWFARIRPEQFAETQTVFGQFTGPVWSHVAYAIDNEVHHRAQGYVYLRALGIEPPAFWQRD